MRLIAALVAAALVVCAAATKELGAFRPLFRFGVEDGLAVRNSVIGGGALWGAQTMLPNGTQSGQK